jgi:hypothetical protein
MNLKRLIVLVGVTLLGTAAFAQDYPKVEVPMDYSYMRFNPENSATVSSFSLNGGGGGIIVNLNHWIGIEGEFEGYATAGTKTFTFTGSNPVCPLGCTVRSATGNLFTYNIGPIFKYRTPHFEPFIETMFGGAHSNVYGDLFKACAGICAAKGAPDNNAWDFIIGGGIDVPLAHWISIRPAQFDFALTRFNSIFTTSNHNQSNFRYQAGVVLRF